MNFYTKEIQLEEYEMIKKINEIDLDYNYHLPLFQNDDKKSWSGETIYINFQHGGVDLSKMDYKKIDINIFFKSLQNIFYGMKDMNEKNFYHLDLKPDNIVFDENTSKMNIIDFGMSMFNPNEPSKQKSQFLEVCVQNTYILWPFEVILFQNSTDIFEKKLQKYLEMANYFNWYSSWTKDRSWPTKMRKNLISISKDDIIPKIDVYTMGLTIFYILYKFYMAEILLEQNFEKQLLLLASKMTDPSTNDRISSKEAYEEYVEILNFL